MSYFALFQTVRVDLYLDMVSIGKNYIRWQLSKSTCVSQHTQLGTGGFCCSWVLLPSCPCIWILQWCLLHHLCTVYIG